MKDQELTQLQETGELILTGYCKVSTILEGLNTLGIDPGNVEILAWTDGIIKLFIIKE